jgi:hypothetical protein
MLLRHATPRRNLRSIFRTGLQPALALGKLKAVWLHATAKGRWAVRHVAGRHQVSVEAVVVLEVRVPRSQLRRNRRGLWYCPFRIDPEQIVSVNGLKIFAA